MSNAPTSLPADVIHPQWIIWTVQGMVISIWASVDEAPRDQADFIARISKVPLIVYTVERARGLPEVGDRVEEPAALGWGEIARHPPGFTSLSAAPRPQSDRIVRLPRSVA